MPVVDEMEAVMIVLRLSRLVEINTVLGIAAGLLAASAIS